MKHLTLQRRQPKASAITRYDPEKGLRSIAVTEAAEKHFARARDTRQLFQAIAEKIAAQADYVVWRDKVVVPRLGAGRPKIGSRGNEPKLPASDPGHDIAHRWRKASCLKDANGATVVDATKVAEVVNDTVRKATRLIERKNKPKAAKQKRGNTVVDLAKLKKATEEAQQRSQQIVEQQQAPVRGTTGTGENEWYTPAEYIELARRVLGEIDLDPASTDAAQNTVRATQYFTKADDGAADDKEWHGRVFLNPFYAQPDIADFVEKLITEVRAGRVTAAIMLTHAYTSSALFQDAARLAAAICFLSKRVPFTKADGGLASPTQGQSVFYYGPDIPAFQRAFADIGFVVQLMRGQTGTLSQNHRA